MKILSSVLLLALSTSSLVVESSGIPDPLLLGPTKSMWHTLRTRTTPLRTLPVLSIKILVRYLLFLV